MSSKHRVYVHHNLALSHALPLALEGVGWLYKSRIVTGPRIPIKMDGWVVFAADNETSAPVKGVICFHRDGSVINITLAYVEPSSRRLGVFHDMLESVKEFARLEGMRRIEVTVPQVKDSVLDAFEDAGFYPVRYMYQLDVAKGDG